MRILSGKQAGSDVGQLIFAAHRERHCLQGLKDALLQRYIRIGQVGGRIVALSTTHLKRPPPPERRRTSWILDHDGRDGWPAAISCRSLIRSTFRLRQEAIFRQILGGQQAWPCPAACPGGRIYAYAEKAAVSKVRSHCLLFISYYQHESLHACAARPDEDMLQKWLAGHGQHHLGHLAVKGRIRLPSPS